MMTRILNVTKIDLRFKHHPRNPITSKCTKKYCSALVPTNKGDGGFVHTSKQTVNVDIFLETQPKLMIQLALESS